MSTERNKRRNVKISGEVHKSLSDYCNSNGIKIGWLVDNIVKEKLELLIDKNKSK